MNAEKRQTFDTDGINSESGVCCAWCHVACNVQAAVSQTDAGELRGPPVTQKRDQAQCYVCSILFLECSVCIVWYTGGRQGQTNKQGSVSDRRKDMADRRWGVG